MDHARANLADMVAHGLADDADAALARITICDTLEETVASVDYIQESVFEQLDLKIEISGRIGEAMRADAIVGSSTSALPASAFTENAPKRGRFIVAHPVNPPHLVPVVELVPAPWTDPEVQPAVRALMERIGQVPVSVTREIEGFILNRLQGALLDEAFSLYDQGYASAADIDATISHGLGLRWSFMGPFETIDLNAPGGVADYAARFDRMYTVMANSRKNPHPWSKPLVDRITAERRAAVPEDQLAARRDWRDRRLMALVAHKRKAGKS